jgi:hypothetical protein
MRAPLHYSIVIFHGCRQHNSTLDRGKSVPSDFDIYRNCAMYFAGVTRVCVCECERSCAFSWRRAGDRQSAVSATCAGGATVDQRQLDNNKLWIPSLRNGGCLDAAGNDDINGLFIVN